MLLEANTKSTTDEDPRTTGRSSTIVEEQLGITNSLQARPLATGVQKQIIYRLVAALPDVLVWAWARINVTQCD